MEGMIAAHSYGTLVTVGTIGWLALVLVPPLLKGEIAFFIVSLFIPGIVIVDVWGVLPAQLDRSDKPQLSLVMAWIAALAPYIILAVMFAWKIWNEWRGWTRKRSDLSQQTR